MTSQACAGMGRGAAAAVLVAWLASPAAGQSAPGVTCTTVDGTLRCGEVLTVRPTTSPWQPLTFVSSSAEELRAFGPDAGEWSDIVRLAAGTTVGNGRVYANGLPLAAMPPAALLSRVTVNGDPFSVERGGTDPLRIDVDLGALDRRWRFNAGLPSLDRGGANPLTPGRRPEVRSLSGSVGGPIGSLPLTFSFHAGRSSSASQPAFLRDAAAHALTTDEAVERTSRLTNAAGEVVFDSPRLVVHALLMSSRMRVANAGIGGIVAPDAAYASTSVTDEGQMTWRVAGDRWRQRGGVSWHGEAASVRAARSDAAVVVTGQSIGGGNAVFADVNRQRTLRLTHVVETAQAARPTLVGVAWTGDEFRDEVTPNPSGRLQLDRPGSASGVWVVTSRIAPVRVATSAASLFGERTLAGGPRLSIRTGARADWQAGDGILLSPRANVATSVAGWQVAAGAGVFADGWPADLLAEIRRRDAFHETTAIVPNAKVDAIGLLPPDAVRLVTRSPPAFTRRRDVLVNVAAQRQAGPWRFGVDHTWTEALRIGGSVRERASGALVDTIASDRRLSREQTHVRVGTTLHGVSTTINYEYARSFDNAAGLFALPARPADVAGEWAASSGIARHYLTLMTTARLPGSIRLSWTAVWRSGLPLTVITGRDADELFSFTDRGGLARNTARGPALRNMSLYLSKRIPLRGLRGSALETGGRIDNLIGRVNATSVGAVMDSAMFGQPLGAAPGRSARMWVTVAR